MGQELRDQALSPLDRISSLEHIRARDEIGCELHILVVHGGKETSR